MGIGFNAGSIEMKLLAFISIVAMLVIGPASVVASSEVNPG
jgi:hypothetical protein